MYPVDISIQLPKLISHSMHLEVISTDNWELRMRKLMYNYCQSKLIASLKMEQLSDKYNVDTYIV